MTSRKLRAVLTGVASTFDLDGSITRRRLQVMQESPTDTQCPDCECCTKFNCWTNHCAGGTCPCTEE